ncbi:MAG: HEAT repeat domain-containing protein [Planctomycetes bacterium]|nr:HEAT repeat domain-containing protein [Planctomycetota bacterium]
MRYGLLAAWMLLAGCGKLPQEEPAPVPQPPGKPPVFVEGFGAADAAAREAAREAVKVLKNARALRQVTSKDVGDRVEGAKALSELGLRYLEHIAQLLEDEEPRVRVAAMEAVVKVMGPAGATWVGRLLVDRDAGVRRCAVDGLCRLGAQEYTRQIVRLLEDRDSEVASSAADALGWIGSREMAYRLDSGLRHSNAEVRRKIAEGMARLGGDYVDRMNVVRSIDREKDPKVREALVLAVGELDGKYDAVDVIKRLAPAEGKDPANGLEMAASISLARLERKGRREVRLIGLVRDEPESRRFTRSLLIALADIHQERAWKTMTKKVAVKDWITTIEDLETLAKQVGISLQDFSDVKFEWTMPAGTRVTLRQLLERVTRDGDREMFVGAGVVRLMKADDALAEWEKALR